MHIFPALRSTAHELGVRGSPSGGNLGCLPNRSRCSPGPLHEYCTILQIKRIDRESPSPENVEDGSLYMDTDRTAGSDVFRMVNVGGFSLALR